MTSSLLPAILRRFRPLLALPAALAASVTLANSVDLTAFNGKYPTYYSTHGCNSCHTASIPALNIYGTAYRTAVLALGGRNATNAPVALSNIESADTDGDGYRNLVELTNNYLAHDAAVHPTASVTLSSGQVAKSGGAGATVPYSVTVTNNGNITDSFALGASVFSGQAWTPSIVGTANSLSAGSTATITVNVAVSAGAANGQTSVARVTAASLAKPTTTATPLDLTTTATVAVTGPRYVNAASGSNAGACTSVASPCRTISYAMGQAAANDQVLVAPGIYDIALGEVFPIAMKSGVRLEATGNAYNTIVDGAGGTAGLLDLAGNTGSQALIRGFTFRNGLRTVGQGGSSLGGALYISGGSQQVTIQRCIFIGNEARGYSADNSLGHTGGLAWGGAIAAFGPMTVIESLFRGNVARGGNGFSHGGTPLSGNEYGGQGHGGAIYHAGTGTIANNTFYVNKAIGGNGGFASNGTGNGGPGAYGGLAATGNPAPSIFNNIFAGNEANSGSGGTPEASSAGAVGSTAAPTFTKNLYFVNAVNGGPSSGDNYGTAAIHADPQFHRAPDNLRVAITSPAYGIGIVGITAVDLDGAIRRNPPSLGCYEADGSHMPATDIDGDGRSDIVWRNTSTGQVYRMRMNGLAITEAGFAYTEPNTAWRVVGDADFNGDGVSDLLWRNTATGQVFMMLFGTGGAPIGGGVFYTEPNAAWTIARTPDLDGDGKADIVWWNSSTGQVYGMLMNGVAITAQGFIYTEPNTAWRIAAVGDFSGSGRQNQLVWRNGATGQVYFMTVTVSPGANPFSQGGQMIYNATLAYKVVGVGDFNGDGRDDILWRHDDNGSLYLFRMNGAAITFEGVIYQEPNTAWKVVAVRDYDGNGKADILYRNDSTGHLYMLLMNDTAVAGQGFVYQEANAAWRILGTYEYGIQ